MAKIPDQLQQSETVRAIYRHHESKSEQRRTYIGASVIGSECDRALWLAFRWVHPPEQFDGRMLRLFAVGHRTEPVLCDELRAIGCEVHDVASDGKQFGFNTLAGHVKCHIDGCALGVPEAPRAWHVLEFKTANRKSFAELQRRGVRDAKPQHWAQMQVAMHLSGMERALYLVDCKDTSELYSERVRHDAEAAGQLLERAKRIIQADWPPPCSGGRWCGCDDAEQQPLLANCRTCVHATPVLEGQGGWRCEHHRVQLTVENQRAGCDQHLMLPSIISWAELCDAGEGFCEYENPDGSTWRNTINAGDGFTSAELAIGGRQITQSEATRAAKAMGLGLEVVSIESEADDGQQA